MTSLFTIAEEIRKCTACPLFKKRMVAITGEGKEKAKVLFISSAPNKDEDRLAKLLVGKQGEFFNKLLNSINLKRKDIYLTSALKCHLPSSYSLTNKEVKTCKNLWLDPQIELLQPKIIVLLGSLALRSILKTSNIKKYHGTLIKSKYFVTYNPQAAFKSQKIKEILFEDFKKLKKLI
jgi:uracil-DNA glycosylase